MNFAKLSSLIPMAALIFGWAGAPGFVAQATPPVPAGTGQAARPAPPIRLGTPATQKAKSNTPKQQPCWEGAGIPKAAMEERRSIQQSRRAEVEAVCMQAGLTDQQKRERIREINQATQQKMAGLITPEQQEKLKTCNQARAATHPGVGHAGGTPHAGGGPCAQFGR
jgi:hypothetical protein